MGSEKPFSRRSGSAGSATQNAAYAAIDAVMTIVLAALAVLTQVWLVFLPAAGSAYVAPSSNPHSRTDVAKASGPTLTKLRSAMQNESYAYANYTPYAQTIMEL